MADESMISPAQERVLLGALKGAIVDVNGGADPNEAIAKHASANGLTPEFACRMVEAYNTTKTLRHYKDNDGEKRADTFDLADRQKVLDAMYKPTTKSAEVVVQYNDPAFFNFNTAPEIPSEGVEKAAAYLLNTNIADRTGLSTIRKNVLEDTRGMLEKVAIARDEGRMLLKHAKETVAKVAFDLAESFRTPDHVPFIELEKRAWSTYGDPCKAAMDIVWSMIPEKLQQREKRADARPATPLVMDHNINFQLVRQLMEAVDAAKQAYVSNESINTNADKIEGKLGKQANALAMRKQSANTEETSEQAGKRLRDMPRPGSGPSGEQRSMFADPDALRKGIEGGAGGGPDPIDAASGGAISSIKAMAGYIGDTPPEAEPILTPEHEARLRMVKAKLMLNNFISNDPVLSGYPTEDVFNAYNELSSTVPGLATNPLMMRTLLAKSLQTEGRLDPLEIKNLLETEKEQRKLRIQGT